LDGWDDVVDGGGESCECFEGLAVGLCWCLVHVAAFRMGKLSTGVGMVCCCRVGPVPGVSILDTHCPTGTRWIVSRCGVFLSQPAIGTIVGCPACPTFGCSVPRACPAFSVPLRKALSRDSGFMCPLGFLVFSVLSRFWVGHL